MHRYVEEKRSVEKRSAQTAWHQLAAIKHHVSVIYCQPVRTFSIENSPLREPVCEPPQHVPWLLKPLVRIEVDVVVCLRSAVRKSCINFLQTMRLY